MIYVFSVCVWDFSERKILTMEQAMLQWLIFVIVLTQEQSVYIFSHLLKLLFFYCSDLVLEVSTLLITSSVHAFLYQMVSCSLHYSLRTHSHKVFDSNNTWFLNRWEVAWSWKGRLNWLLTLSGIWDMLLQSFWLPTESLIRCSVM